MPKGADPDKVFALIWTTTPWTIPCNVAISANENFEYVWVRIGDEYLLMAKDLVEPTMKAGKVEDYEVLPDVMTGKQLEGLVFKHPFYDRKVPIILGDHVTLEAGTGLVHTAPDHGQDDFDVCKKYAAWGLKPLGTVDGTGRYTDKVPGFEGQFVFDTNVPVIKKLAELGALFAKSTFRHQYPHCWRCKEPIIYRATEQWFASVDGFRQKALDAIDTVKWIPSWGHDRIYNMIHDRGDWCISRQRVWACRSLSSTAKTAANTSSTTKPSLICRRCLLKKGPIRGGCTTSRNSCRKAINARTAAVHTSARKRISWTSGSTAAAPIRAY